MSHFAGLGLFEYMWLADELKAEPIYVINNGISHQEATPPARLRSYIQETMDALEFITGDASTPWGSVRASMGRQKPWSLRFVAIGNEVIFNVQQKAFWLSSLGSNEMQKKGKRGLEGPRLSLPLEC